MDQRDGEIQTVVCEFVFGVGTGTKEQQNVIQPIYFLLNQFENRGLRSPNNHEEERSRVSTDFLDWQTWFCSPPYRPM